MVNIRRGVFETNSSSVHAIVIGNSYYNIDHIDLHLDEYGWEFSTVTDTASYLYSAMMELGMITEFDTLCRKLEERGISINIIDKPDENLQYGVDHCGELKPFIEDILNNDDLMLRFLCGDSFIRTGNDNAYDEVDCSDAYYVK